MAKRTAAAVLSLAMIAGCGGTNAPAPGAGGSSANPTAPINATSSPAVDEAVATVNGKPIGREQLVKPLIESYGLNLLLQIIQLELARQDAIKAKIVVSTGDFKAERESMLKGFFPDAQESDYDALLDQLLKQQNLSRPQFEILLQTNTYLRKMAEPLCANRISDENVQQAFDVMYGATVKIRDVQVSNMRDALEVKRRAVAGEDFGDLAEKLSEDPRTRGLRGEWPAFSRNSVGISDVLKEQAFGLKENEISDPINTEGAFHVIKVEKHLMPRVAKLDEPTKASIRKALGEKLVQETMKALRARTAQEAMQANVLDIRDSELKKQFDERLAEHKRLAAEEEKTRQQQLLKALVPSTQASPKFGPLAPPATAPATGSPTAPATRPAGTEASERPPATKSGEAAKPAAPDAPKP